MLLPIECIAWRWALLRGMNSADMAAEKAEGMDVRVRKEVI